MFSLQCDRIAVCSAADVQAELHTFHPRYPIIILCLLRGGCYRGRFEIASPPVLLYFQAQHANGVLQQNFLHHLRLETHTLELFQPAFGMKQGIA